jgi:hypothetical protein
MPKLQTIEQRQKELQAMLTTPAGQEELRKLEARCQDAGERLRVTKESIITYILVHERTHGRIAG